jgi:tetratricopeptide (TPR) repeat protein
MGEPVVFPAKKAEGTFRIFVLGESAALGTPDSAYNFSRMLNRMLAEAYPQVEFEVINAAITAINSHVVREIAYDCARYDPDLFFVYMGNNEVVGPHGPGTVFTGRAAPLPLVRLSIRIKATRLGQLLTAAASTLTAEESQPVTWAGMEMFLGNQVRATDPRMRRVYKHFRANLKAIHAAAQAADAAVVFCTLAGNLKDCPPFASLHRPDLSEADLEQWQHMWRVAKTHEEAGLWEQAVESYLAAERLDDAFAELHFRLGKCYWAVGRFESAKQRFLQARRLDTLRFRPDERIQEIIREVAAGGPDACLLDVLSVFEQNSPHGCPGRELLYEHVHMNFRGNYLLAKTAFERLGAILVKQIPGLEPVRATPLSETDCAERLAFTPWDRHATTRTVLDEYIREPPFTNQAYHAGWVRSLEQELAGQSAGLTADGIERSNRIYQTALTRSPGDWRLHYKYAEFLRDAMNDNKRAIEHFRLVAEAVPHAFIAHAALNLELVVLGRYRESIPHGLRAVEIMPTYSPTHNNLGAAYVKLNRLNEAKTHFQQAVRWSPNNLPAHNSLIDILAHQDKIDEAITACRRALQFLPDDALLHCRLGTMLGMQGKRAEGLEEIRLAARLDPNSATIRSILNRVSR